MENVKFEVIAQEFKRRTREVVYCTASTTDRKNRIRSRVLHPVWEDAKGYVTTRRAGLLAKHLVHNPHISVTYLKASTRPFATEQVHADCVACWDDTDEGRVRGWALFEEGSGDAVQRTRGEASPIGSGACSS